MVGLSFVVMLYGQQIECPDQKTGHCQKWIALWSGHTECPDLIMLYGRVTRNAPIFRKIDSFMVRSRGMSRFLEKLTAALRSGHGEWPDF